jgi:hypothetical protein
MRYYQASFRLEAFTISSRSNSLLSYTKEQLASFVSVFGWSVLEEFDGKKLKDMFEDSLHLLQSPFDNCHLDSESKLEKAIDKLDEAFEALESYFLKRIDNASLRRTVTCESVGKHTIYVTLTEEAHIEFSDMYPGCKYTSVTDPFEAFTVFKRFVDKCGAKGILACSTPTRRARIIGLVSRSDLNNTEVDVGDYTDGRHICMTDGKCIGVKHENMVFACDYCSAIKSQGAIRTVCVPNLLLCQTCSFATVSGKYVTNDAVHTANGLFTNRTPFFQMLSQCGYENVNLYNIVVRFLEQVMCGYAEENFYIEPLLFSANGFVSKAHEMPLHILTEREHELQAHRLRDTIVVEKITHKPITVTFAKCAKSFALEYWGCRPIDGSDGHRLGGILPLALSNVLNLNMLWCSVHVRHL